MEGRTPSVIPDGEKRAFVPNGGKRAVARPKSVLAKRFAVVMVTSVLLAAMIAATALQVRAAVVLEYFNAIASGSVVLLEWSTASEFNVAGFEILKKGVDEPESSFSRIGFYNAKGDTSSGALYDTVVNNLAADTAYCFRLREVTTDDEPGEVRDLCGYGLSITPTPGFADPSDGTTAGTIAAATTGAVLFPTPTQDPLLVPTPTIDPLAQQQFPTPDPFAQPTPDPFAQQSPLPTQVFDPFAQPTPDPFAQPTLDPFAQQPVAQQPAIDPVTGWQIDPATGYPINPATGLPTDPATAAMIVQQPVSPLDAPAAAPALIPTATSHFPGAEAGVVDVTPSPTSIYIVVTAAPAGADGNEGVAAVVTPWPTVAPTPAPLLNALLMPNAQNLTVLMLCFIFISATALGGLGLMTVVLYLRSRNQREEDRARLRARHHSLL